jgi:hypothetical protein
MHLPIDWPRINQFPEYFTIEKKNEYTIMTDNTRNEQIIKGSELENGFQIRIKGGKSVRIVVIPSMSDASGVSK